ncbi:plant intracellular Ras-group-related LRR protein 8 isoform X2 [Ricinus communis]|uniref:plant intracellular Ras-group-related LRR protein 8 isoform X2 n=1 Tax=Ricinus communis TaxID=3988 RepID=UPI0007721FA5|nr:plant intracellular Ras-group-related LRR protein 8 isoform X2 [Ricinus communis]|eukprot:XP_015579324.1 plant intracellular Ras-group-related LRR protein 8 isoform X2 [Ricinus communis]
MEGEDSNSNTINITVKFSGRSIPISVSLNSTVRDLKCLLQPLTNVLPRGQKLICKGRVLTDTMTLMQSELTNGVKIMLVASQGLHQGVIPDEVWACGILTRVLDVSNNCIQDIPTKISSLSSMQKLILNGNGMSDESIQWEGFTFLKHLTILSLNRNHLSILPSELGALSSLRQLHVSNNKLNCLPVEIGLLTQLEILRANNNRICSLPASIGNCKSLVEVDLSSNLLIDLPESFGNLHNLKAVQLGNNGLKSLPSTLFKMCLQLSTLDLHNTEITTDMLRQFEGWEAFDDRRRLKHQKQLDFRVVGSAEFDEGADKN